MEAPPHVLPLQQLPWSPARTPSHLWTAAHTGGDVTDSTYEQHVCQYKQILSSSLLHLSSLQWFLLHLWWHCPRPLRLPRRLSPPPHKSPLWEISAGDGEAVGTPLWAQAYYRLCLLWVLWTATSILSHTATRGEGGEAWWGFSDMLCILWISLQLRDSVQRAEKWYLSPNIGLSLSYPLERCH